MRASPRPSLAWLCLLVALLAGCAWMEAEPVPRNPAPVFRPETRRLGDVTVHRFPNRLTLVHRRNTANSIVAVHCLAGDGAVSDPDERAGRANLMTRVLTKGTATRSADDIAGALDAMGASVSAAAGTDFVTVSLQCVRDDLAAAFDIFADVIRRPSFPLEEIDTERVRVLADIRMREDHSVSAAMKRFRAQLFGSHPYARQPGGEPETVAALTQIDLVAAHRLAFRPENMVVSIVGDISLEDARTLVASAFGDMEASGEPVLEARRSFAPTASRTEFERDVEQGIVVLGTRGCSHSDPDSAALDVATAILGQGMSSRLFTELRDRQGLAYMVGAQSNEMHLAGFVLTYIGTSPATVDRALDGLWEQLSLMREEPVTTEELERAIAYLVGGYLRDHESNSRQAYYLGFWEACGLGAEYDTRYPELVRAVTVRDVMKVANKYFNDPTVVVLRPRPGPAATEAAPAP